LLLGQRGHTLEVSMWYNLIILMAFTIVSAWIDYEHLKDNDYIESHTSRFLLRGLFFIALWIYGPNYWMIGGSALFFAATFDSVLNVMRGKPLFYLGQTAKWDKFWREHERAYIAMKVMCLVLSVMIYLQKQ